VITNSSKAPWVHSNRNGFVQWNSNITFKKSHASVHGVCKPHFVRANAVLSLEFVALPLSGFHHQTVASVPRKLPRVIKSLVVLLFLFALPTFNIKPPMG